MGITGVSSESSARRQLIQHHQKQRKQPKLSLTQDLTTLRVLAPKTATCSKPVCLRATCSDLVWDSFRWCTGGEILMTKQPSHRLHVWDACNMDFVCKIDAQFCDLHWAWQYPSSSEEMALVTYHVPEKTLLGLRKRQGQWSYERMVFNQAVDWVGGCISPNGDDLITLHRELDGSSSVYHYNLKTHEGKNMASAYCYEPLLQQELCPENDRFPGHVTIAWAPLPSAWQHVYAYVHLHRNTSGTPDCAHQSLRLMKCNHMHPAAALDHC